jgi:hypothetical protein
MALQNFRSYGRRGQRWAGFGERGVSDRDFDSLRRYGDNGALLDPKEQPTIDQGGGRAESDRAGGPPLPRNGANNYDDDDNGADDEADDQRVKDQLQDLGLDVEGFTPDQLRRILSWARENGARSEEGNLDGQDDQAVAEAADKYSESVAAIYGSKANFVRAYKEMPRSERRDLAARLYVHNRRR